MEKEFENSFDAIYENIYEKSVGVLNEAKSKKNKFLLILFIALIIINLFIFIIPQSRNLVVLSITISIIVMMIIMLVGSQSYRKLYKDCVINNLVKQYNPNLNYDQKIGINYNKYRESSFDITFDEYYSEDRIYGSLDSGENFEMAEVVTEQVNRYKDANNQWKEEKTELFRGIYGIVYLNKNILSKIYIASDFALRKFSKDRIEVDSSEFEKYYDLVTKDKVKGMSIFTSELIEKYVDIVKDSNNSFELKIEGNMIYFRYKCSNIFEPPTFKTGLDKEFVKKYYKLIYYPIEIIKNTVENINQVEE